MFYSWAYLSRLGEGRSLWCSGLRGFGQPALGEVGPGGSLGNQCEAAWASWTSGERNSVPAPRVASHRLAASLLGMCCRHHTRAVYSPVCVCLHWLSGCASNSHSRRPWPWPGHSLFLPGDSAVVERTSNVESWACVWFHLCGRLTYTLDTFSPLWASVSPCVI